MCRTFKISRSAYYKWLKSQVPKREKENILLTEEITKLFNQSKQTYGSPSIPQELKRQGIKASRTCVARLMRKLELRSKVKKKYKATTGSGYKYPVAENILNRQFVPDTINQAWVSDITYIRTKQGWLYLTAILDFMRPANI